MPDKVAQLETEVADLQEQLSATEARGSNLEERVKLIESKNTDLTRLISNLEAERNLLKEKLETVEEETKQAELEKLHLEIQVLTQERERLSAESRQIHRFSWRWHGVVKFLSTCLLLLASIGVFWTYTQWVSDYRRARFQKGLEFVGDSKTTAGGVILLGKVTREWSWPFKPRRKGQALQALAATLAGSEDALVKEMCLQSLEDVSGLRLHKKNEVLVSVKKILSTSPRKDNWAPRIDPAIWNAQVNHAVQNSPSGK